MFGFQGFSLRSKQKPSKEASVEHDDASARESIRQQLWNPARTSLNLSKSSSSPDDIPIPKLARASVPVLPTVFNVNAVAVPPTVLNVEAGASEAASGSATEATVPATVLNIEARATGSAVPVPPTSI